MLSVSGNVEAIKRSIRNGQGISVMSEYAVRQELDLGLLKQVPILDHGGLKRELYLIRRNDTELKLSASMFIDFFKKAAEQKSIPV